jgi:signal transduction histidine kinase
MRHLRTKLLLAMMTVVIVTVAVSALFTRRVMHEEMKRLTIERPLADFESQRRSVEDYYRAHRSWIGLPFRDRAILTTPSREVITTSTDIRAMKVTVSRDDNVTIAGPRVRLLVRVPPQPIRDDGRVIALLYILPDRSPVEGGQIAAIDRRLVITFAAATLAALLLTLLLSRRVTRPVERLTSAVDEMARGSFPLPVPISGEDEIARLARSFNAMSASIATQQELRRRLVSDVAHELRTPLTNLRCELEAVQDGLSTVNVASLHEEVLHLSRLVEDLQELAVADAGGVKLKLERIDLAEVVRRAVTLVQRPVDVHAESTIVEADETRVRQILRNLLDNAVRHTPEDGAIEIRVRNASVAIHNAGDPIPANDLENIFDRFYRVDESRNRSSGGAGLGLAIVRRLVELHGGRVWAESDETGNTFTFTLGPPASAGSPAGFSRPPHAD